MAEQQVLLSHILSTKYTKQLGSNWKRVLKAVKDIWTNKQSNVSDSISAAEEGYDSDTTTDSDSTDD